MATAGRKTYHHGDLKKALLEETVRILREEGEEALSLRTLASNLGVSRTAPYNHFESKDSLLSAVAEEGFRLFNAAVSATRKKYRGKNGRDLTRALVKTYVNFAQKNREFYDLMYARKIWQGANVSEPVATVARGTLRSDIERLQRAQERGLINQDVDVVRYVQMYWGTLHGISRLLLDGVYTASASVNKLCESTADMLWQQIEPG